jgi:hypothetical protein
MMRVGILDGGVEHVKLITPAERLRIIEQERREAEIFQRQSTAT